MCERKKSPQIASTNAMAVSAQLFDLFKRRIVSGQKLLDLVKFEMMAWEKLTYRESAVLGSCAARTVERNTEA